MSINFLAINAIENFIIDCFTSNNYFLIAVLLWGNPHKEVDSDMFYIFNGFGEYNMIDR